MGGNRAPYRRSCRSLSVSVLENQVPRPPFSEHPHLRHQSERHTLSKRIVRVAPTFDLFCSNECGNPPPLCTASKTPDQAKDCAGVIGRDRARATSRVRSQFKSDESEGTHETLPMMSSTRKGTSEAGSMEPSSIIPDEPEDCDVHQATEGEWVPRGQRKARRASGRRRRQKFRARCPPHPTKHRGRGHPAADKIPSHTRTRMLQQHNYLAQPSPARCTPDKRLGCCRPRRGARPTA